MGYIFIFGIVAFVALLGLAYILTGRKDLP